MSYEKFVGRRYLLPKDRSLVASFITLLAVVGVALGVTALIVVLSVMGGFTQDLTDNILGARAHIVIQDPDLNPMQNSDAVAEEVMGFDGVIGASPFIEAELMVSSPTNLNGVVLRGVDVDRVADVSVLLQELEEGSLQYLLDDTPLMEEVTSRRQAEVNELFEQLDRETNELREMIDRREGRQGGSDEILPVGDMDGDDPLPLPELSGEADQGSMPSIFGDEPAGGSMPSLFSDDPFDGDLPELPDLDDGDGAVLAMPPIPSQETSRPAYDPSRVPGIIIGSQLKRALNVELGDEVNVVSPHGEMGPTGPLPRSRPFRVVGVFHSGLYEYDANHAYTALHDAAHFLNMDGVTGVELRTFDVDASVAIADEIRAALDQELEVLNWQDLNSSLFLALRLEKIAMFIILTFIILVASFSIVAMLIMIVIEKGREIAILKSMGATNGGIMRIFIYQGMVIGCIGAVVGLVSGLTICYLLATKQLPLDPEVYYIPAVPVNVDPVEIVAVVICTVIISFLATLYPSYQAAKLNPVEGLRYD